MPQQRSAGVLLFRRGAGGTEVLLIRPGGPFWRNKDVGAWMIPKGAIERGERPAEAALRELVMDRGSAQQLLNLGRQLADSSLLRAALRELPADSPARSLIVAETQELEA